LLLRLPPLVLSFVDLKDRNATEEVLAAVETLLISLSDSRAEVF
jgi:hypothetical protein